MSGGGAAVATELLATEIPAAAALDRADSGDSPPARVTVIAAATAATAMTITQRTFIG
jgi:hypothetical protein